MFRRLAETFQNEGGGNGNGSGGHQQFVAQQNTYFNALSNIYPSASSGLKGFNTAIQSVDPVVNTYQPPVVKSADNIFMSNKNSNLDKLAKLCESSSLDDLIRSQNPSDPIRCGWMYTPPPSGSPTPTVSQGFVGDENGPNPIYNPTAHKKWFFDLQMAKRQSLLDKCKALKNCGDVDDPMFKGECGYCTDTNQGIPIDSNGNPLYSDNAMANCSPASIVTSGANCPAPQPIVGPKPNTDTTCDPVNGRLSAVCLYNQVLSGGCSDKGVLAIALGSNPPPNDYIGNIRSLDSVKIYNRVANPPLKLDVFSKGNQSIATVLQEVKQLATAATTNPTNSAIGAAARDLCIQSGAMKAYDFCGDLPDSTTAPFDISCLQTLFKKMGGQPTGSMYPSNVTIGKYNTMVNLGAIKQYWTQLIANMKNKDYATQADALNKILGIKPERVIKRAPLNSGVEVFWFSVNPSNGNGWPGFLRRTFESDIPNFPNGDTSVIPQVGFVQYGAFLALTDIRATVDSSVKFQVLVDDGFWLAINQPFDFDYYAAKHPIEDSPGYAANNQIQGPTTYNFNSCTNISSTLPNIMKLFYSDTGGGGHTIQVTPISCGTGVQPIQKGNYSLTCEARAPFLNYEVNIQTMTFEDTRSPQIFSNYVTSGSIEYHVRAEERMSVPGKKGFMRFNNANSYVNITNIAYQSWGTVTMPFRLQSMPVKDSIMSFWSGSYYLTVFLTPLNGSTAQVNIQTNIGGNRTVVAQTTVGLNQWYMLFVANKGTGLDVYINSVNELIKNKGVASVVSFDAGAPIYTVNGLFVPGGYACNVGVGGKVSGFSYANATFNYDVAWVHFFDHHVNQDDIYRDCMSNWIFTQFPSEYGKYDIF